MMKPLGKLSAEAIATLEQREAWSALRRAHLRTAAEIERAEAADTCRAAFAPFPGGTVVPFPSVRRRP